MEWTQQHRKMNTNGKQGLVWGDKAKMSLPKYPTEKLSDDLKIEIIAYLIDSQIQM